MRPRTATTFSALTTAAVLLGVWEIAFATGLLDFESISRPSRFLSEIWEIALSGKLLDETVHTLQVVAIAFTIAFIVGLTVGALMALSRTTRRLLLPTTTFLRFVPPPALVPLTIIIFGFAMRSEVLVAAYAATWPVMISATTAVAQIDPRLHEVGKALGLNRAQVFMKLTTPASLPLVLSGARIALSVTFVVVITVEMIGVPEGLGYEIVRSSQSLRPDETYAYLFWIGLVGAALNFLLRRIEGRVVGWQLSDAS